MEVTIIGTGYVGLTSAVCLAEAGHLVTCIDINENIIQKINSGKSPIHEPNLEKLLKNVLKKRRLKASNNLEEALENSEIILIAVGTPILKGEIDLTYIKSVGEQIALWLKKHQKFIPIIIKSTVTPKTTDTFFREIIENTSLMKHPDFGLGMNPEFLREGNAVSDFMNPDRIVIGFEDQPTRLALTKLYESFNCKKLYVNTRTAELIKYTNNALLATQISFSNEMANLATSISNIDYKKVIEGVLSDHRWLAKRPYSNDQNPSIKDYLSPGCGFGGSCFPKDLKAITNYGLSKNLEMTLLKSVLEVNEKQPRMIINLLKENLHELKNKFATLILGLSFKPNTDDVRSSPAKFIIEELLSLDLKIYAHDPQAINNFKREFYPKNKNIKFITDWRGIINKVDLIILITTWEEYLDLHNLAEPKHIIIDPRRYLDVKKLSSTTYKAVGYLFD